MSEAADHAGNGEGDEGVRWVRAASALESLGYGASPCAVAPKSLHPEGMSKAVDRQPSGPS
jgi:hypothetical protein